MKPGRQSSRVGPASASARFIALVTCVLVLDVLVAWSSLMEFDLYNQAPKDQFVVAGDDPSYVLSGLVTVGMSLLRDLGLALIAVGIVRRLRRLDTGTSPAVVLVCLVAVATEVVRVGVGWVADHPTSATCGLTVSACVVNALAVAAVAFGLGRASGRSERPRAS